MKSKKMGKWIKNNLKVLFCYFLIFIAFMLAFVVFILKPMKLITTYIYNTGISTELKEVVFPVEQEIKIDVDNLNAITIYPEDSSLNDYQYQIKLTDSEGKQYFYHDYIDYKADYIYLYFGNIPDSKNKTLHLTIECKKCQNVKMSIGKPLNKGTSILGSDEDTLKISMNSYSKNNSYYWYSILTIVIALILLPLARGEKKYEK